ncbi:MAG: MFS transporter [Bacteroidales bacterium]
MKDSKLNTDRLKVGANGFLGLFSIVGISLYGLPFFYDFWVQDFGWSRVTVTSGNAFGKITVGFFAFFAGWIIDKIGPKKVMIAGIMAGGLALVGLSQVNSLWQFYAFYLLSAVGYMCGGPLPNQVLISRWFSTSRGKAMGIAYIGIGAGGMLVPQIAKSLILHFDWHFAMMILGFLMIIISLPMTILVKDNPETTDSVTPIQKEKIPLKSVLKGWPFYLLLIGSMCSIGAVSGTNQNLKLYFSLDLKYAQTTSANIISIVLASSILGRLFMGWLADKMNKKYVMILIYSIVAGSIVILYNANSIGMVYFFAFVFGIGLGGDYMIIPLMAAELFGVKMLGRIMGIILTFDGIAEAFSPMLVGWIRDKYSDYSLGFLGLIILGIIGTLAILFLPVKKKPQPESE